MSHHQTHFTYRQLSTRALISLLQQFYQAKGSLARG
jgi:hypothetical protein